MSFANYQVETRERVKCVSAIEGVPISTQWSRQGYFYPIQIAQFGLSHYSKELQRNKREVAEAGDDEDADDEDTNDDDSRKKGFAWLKNNNDPPGRRRTEVVEDAEDRGHLVSFSLTVDFYLSITLSSPSTVYNVRCACNSRGRTRS